MKLNNETTRISILSALLLLTACSGATSTPSTGSPSGAGTADKGAVKDETQPIREALSFVAPCTASSCGDLPTSSSSARSAAPSCELAGSTCSWTDSGDDPVSYSPCDEALCGIEPDATVCPAGTTFKGASCGSENDGACTWRSACAAAPNSPICPDPTGCGPKPEIGIVCKDGSVGDLACRSLGAKCDWERTCE